MTVSWETVLIIVAAAALGAFAWRVFTSPPLGPTSRPAERTKMTITSPAFSPNEAIPAKYTCDGENVSPPLSLAEVPVEAKSLALLVDDPDAAGGDWVHWLVWNIPPTTTEIAEGEAPPGVEGTTDFRRPGWGGPCPPSGTHRYHFKLLALDREMDLPPEGGKKELLPAINGHTLAEAVLIGLYARGR